MPDNILDTTIEGLEITRNIIEEGWIQNFSAVNEYGEGVEAESEEAVAWCVTGAMRKATALSPELDIIKMAIAVSATIPEWMHDKQIGESIETYYDDIIEYYNDFHIQNQEEAISFIDDALTFVRSSNE